MEKMKAGSPSNGPFLIPCHLVHRGPKKTQKKIVFLEQELFDDFFAGFGICLDDWKKKKEKEEDEKENEKLEKKKKKKQGKKKSENMKWTKMKKNEET